EQEWVGSGTERSVSYTYLPPGNYEFLVQACNNDGVWNEKGARLQFRVLPFFRQTWWFKTLIIMLVTAILFTIYSIRIARLRALERLRLRIARDLHDDVGSNLGSISLLSQVMEKHPSPEDARQIHSIVSHTVDTLRDIVWFIDPTHERLSDMVARMGETAKAMLPATPYIFEQSGDFSSARLPLDFRRNVMPIFKEALHNTNKHAHASQITIQVSCTNHYFQFTIRDNGQGFDMKSTPLGNGLKNFQRRAKEMNAKLDLKSAPGEGTSITLTAKTP
ncbi:MAG: triple tyrosine motif-containing protein, partial [Verrucomicrobiota bacterium]